MPKEINWVPLFIIVEFLTVIFIVFSMYVMKFFFSIKEKRVKETEKNLHKYVLNLIELKKPIDPLDFKKDWVNLEFLLDLLEEYDKTQVNESWYSLRFLLLNRVMLPKARLDAYSSRWESRLLAARVFTLVVEPADEKNALHLLKDRVALVGLEAAFIVRCLPTKAIVNALIDQITKEKRRLFGLYLRVFDNLTSKVAEMVLERLSYEKETIRREFCYKVLILYEIPVYYPGAYADVQSDNLELALAAIKLIKHTEQERSLSLLEGLLEDPRFEVQVTALKLLADLRALDAISNILNSVHSKNWWVRVNAILALKKMGALGVKALRSVKEKKDRFAYQEIQYILNQEFEGGA